MYTCTFCVAAKAGSSRALTFTSDTDWLEHLISPEHGEVQRTQGAKKSMAQWDDNRTVVVSGIVGLKARSIINYFIGFGDLQNFYYVHKEDGKSQYCKVLMVEEKSAKIIHKAGNHTIGNITFQTRIQNKPAAKPPPLPPPPPQSKLDMHPFLSATEIASTSTTSDSIPTSIASTISSSKSTRVSARFRKLYGTSEGGFSKDGGYRCQICELSVGRGEEQWVQHLISLEKHQDVHRQNQHLRKVLWDLDKKLMITQTKGLKSVHILRYVSAVGGPVIDFSYLAKPKNDGDINVCYVLFATKGAAEKLAAPPGTHCIGPQRKNVLMSLIDEKTKLKWLKWKDKLLNSSEECDFSIEDDDGDNREESIPESENKADGNDNETLPKDEEEMTIQIVSVTTLVPTTITEEKPSLNASPGENQFSSFKGLSLEAQLEQCRTAFGWSQTFSNNAIQFVNQTVGKLNLKRKKIPFGDLTTGLGLQRLSTLQLLVDVQELLESRSTSADSMISSIVKSSAQALLSLKEKRTTEHPILKISTVDSTEICINSVIAGKATNLKLRFSNSLPSHECNLFKLFCNLDPRILPMSFVIVLWATSNNFLQDFKQSYPNQIIVLLIMGFLQNKKVLPTVQKLQEIVSDSESQNFVNGNNVTFCTDVDAIKKLHPNPLEDILEDDTIKAMSVMGLIKDWFQLFANADLKENAICTRFGYLIPKKDFQPHSVGNLPGDLCRVYRFGMMADRNDRSSNMSSAIDSVSTKKFMCSQTPLCIQHPFDLSLNCSRGVTPGEVTRFQNGCKEAVMVLSNLLTSDQPDLTEFLTKTIPLNKATIIAIPGEVCIDSPPTKKIDAVIPIAISNVTGNSQSASNCDLPVTASSSKTAPTPPPAQPKSRPGASDFFDAVGISEDQNNDADMISEDDEPSDSIFIKDCTVFLNLPLFNYWERTFSGTRDMQYQKLQLLILQHILEFNQKFWTNCLGLVNMPKIGQKFWAEEYSKVVHDGKIRSNQTVLQKVMAISDSEKQIDLSFRVKSDGRTIHKIFLDEYSQSLRPKTWASGKSLTDFSLLLYEEVPETRLQEIKTSSFIACNKLQPEICYDCRLLGEISRSFSRATPLATLTMTGVSPGMNAARVDVIKSVYRKLAMSYINKMVKRWLYESKDFDEKKADNFVKGRNEKWNQKANKKRKYGAKLQANKKEDRSVPVASKNLNQIPIHNPRSNNNGKNHNNIDRTSTASGQNFRPQLVRTPTKSNLHSGLPPQLMSLTVRPTTNTAKPQQQQQSYNQRQTTWASGSGGNGGGNRPQFSQQHPSSYARQQNISYGSSATALGPSSYNYEPPYQERIMRNPEPQEYPETFASWYQRYAYRN